MDKTYDLPLDARVIKRLSRNLNKLAKDLMADGDVVVDMERAIGEEIASEVRTNITQITGGEAGIDGNYLGLEDPNSSVVVVGSINNPTGHDVEWQGIQIAYVEFGTGAAAFEGLVNRSAMSEIGYAPDPTKTEWYYRDPRLQAIVKSEGLPAMAPVWKAAITAKANGRRVCTPAVTILRKAVSDAFVV